MHVYACACTCAGRDLFIALLLLLAIFKWALGTTHFPVRALGPRDHRSQGKSHTHFEEHQSALPTQQFQDGRKEAGAGHMAGGSGWGGSKFSKSAVRHGCWPWRPVASGGCHSLS